MYDVHLAHPDSQQLTAFAQGRLGEAELAEVHAHLSECAECRSQVEMAGDDTLVALLRSADTKTNTKEPVEALTVAAAKPAVPDLPSELAQHGRYRVQELLGVGGMGAVYKAEHLLMERPVALKLINHSLTSDPAMVERFRREVKTAGQLKHANIVMAYDAEQAGDVHFLVMEYVEGKSLARVVAEQGPLPVRQACDYIRQAALGLQYAHERGMVHRDIKPQNLMLTPDGQVKILDFGLARFAMETAPAPLAALPVDTSLTQVGIVMGTPGYIAPEQAKDAHTADIRADIYSLGCTLYDLLAGHAPFTGDTVMSKVMAHIEQTPQPLTEVRRDVPPALARVVERMMGKDPARRYQTPAEVAKAVAPFAAPPAVSRRWRNRLARAAAVVLCMTMLGVGTAFYGPSVYRIVTNQGTLVIEVNDPQVEVALKNSSIVVRDRAANRTYDVNIGRRDVKAGDYQLQVKDAAGLQLFTQDFLIQRNGETAVRITFDPPMAVAKAEDKKAGRIPFAFLAHEGHTAMRFRSIMLVFQGIDDTKAPRSRGAFWIPWRGMTMREAGLSVYDGFPVDQHVADAENTITAGPCRMKLIDEGQQVMIKGKVYKVYGEPQIIWLDANGNEAVFRPLVSDHERVQGFWRAIAGMERGEKKSEAYLKQVTLRFAGDTLELTQPGQSGKGTFKLDPSRTPKRIDVTYQTNGKSMTSHGVYSLDGGTLRIVIGSPDEGDINDFGTDLGGDFTLQHEAAGPRKDAALQGVWRAEQVEEHGKTLKGEQLTKSLYITLTVESGKAHLRSRMGGANGPLTREIAEGALVLGEDKGTKRLIITPSATSPKQLLGLYRLEGGTLTLCYRVDPADQQFPKDFADKREGVTRMVLKNLAPQDAVPGKGRLINTFGTGFKPISRDGVTEEAGGWRIDSTTARFVRLYEVQPPLEDCLLTYRAKMKCAKLEGKAYLEMLVRFPAGEFFSKGLQHAISGTTDWTSVAIPFVVQKNERPDLCTLCVRVEGAGTVWIKDIELWQAPLPPELKRPPNAKDGKRADLVKSFTRADRPISNRPMPDEKGWRIETDKKTTVPLFVVKDFRDDNCMAIYRAQLKSSAVKGKAYLEMLVHIAGEPDDREHFSRDLVNPVSGTTDWASYQTPFRFEKGQRPDRIRLNLVIEGSGTVWIRDIELLRGPPLAK